ncbi:MAG TPA: hypothetical protein DD490_17815 [Acidobacteria bacterium]|nr:hypothetical protein [Acidobacteriota bacterium]
MQTPDEIRRLLIALGLGVAAFAGGLGLARTRVPDYRLDQLPAQSTFLQRYAEVTRGLGIRWAEEEPRLALSDAARDAQLADALGLDSSLGRPRIQVSRDAFLPAANDVRELTIDFSPDGRPRAVRWQQHGWRRYFADFTRPNVLEPLFASFSGLLLTPGESIGQERSTSVGGAPARIYPILGGAAPAHLFAIESPGGGVAVARRPGDVDLGLAVMQRYRSLAFLQEVVPPVLRTLAVLLLFLVLTARGRIGLAHGALLGGVTLAVSAAAGLAGQWSPEELAYACVQAVLSGLWIFLVWSAGESFLRASDPGFSTSLDALLRGRLGPRGGRALLHGVALGAGLAGLLLLLRTTAAALPGVWFAEPALRLPVFGVWHHPLRGGIWLAAMALILLGITRRLFAARQVPWATALAGALLAPPLAIQPYVLGLAANFALYLILVHLGSRYGLTTLLTASLTAVLLPAAAFAAQHLAWLPGTFAATAGPTAAFIVLGLVGLLRPDTVEAQRLQPPAFMRRIEEERRLRYEMQLLARMQEGLLPQHVPAVAGWDLAARSILATEAGGDLYDFLFDDDGQLWIAVGDVAGHGYSCAIVQAMTTAALTSLIRPGLQPSEVLLQVDRVIRRGGSPRNFASLTLLRIDPQSGGVVISNAGHPFPLLVLDGDVSEIVLPGLPLGKGPERRYLDVTFHLPPGSALVFCSDGLMETMDGQEKPYGFDRPLEVLRRAPGTPADAILDLLLADWRRHLGTEEPPDDTTVVVVKRSA